MGRSVSYANNYTAIAYKDISRFGYGEDEDGNEATEFDEFQAQCDWDWFIEDIQDTVASNWKTFEPCDKWLEREVHAIMENELAYVTVSEYCGLVSLCLVRKYEYDDDYFGDEYKKANMAVGFCKRIAPKFEKLFSELIPIGRFSNGEVVFQKIAS